MLYDFNGGNSCIQYYINQHVMFAAKAPPTSAPISSSRGRDVEKEVTDYFGTVRTACMKEWSLIQRVFPNFTEVMSLFVQRIFVQEVGVCQAVALKSLRSPAIWRVSLRSQQQTRF